MDKVAEWSRRIIQRELQREVVLNDDGTKPGMYDLRIGPADSPVIAIECVGAVDPIRTETWNRGPGRGPLTYNLRGEWHVELAPHAKLKNVLAQLESLLQACEQKGLSGFVPLDDYLRRTDRSLHTAFQSLHIRSVHCFRSDGSGTVHLGMTGRTGWVDTQGTAVPGWIGDFLRAPERADVLSKLARSGAPECHVAVPVAFGGPPWEVESYLTGRIEVLPSAIPELPSPVNAVWIMNATNGLYFDGISWRLFATSFREPAIR